MRIALQEKAAPAETVVGALPAVLPVRWWTVALGLVLIVPNNYWVVYMEKVRTGPYPTTISIFANCVFLLVVLLIVNAPLRWWLPRVALNRAELLTVYSMLCLGSALAGLDMIPVLVQMMGHPFQFGNESNGWLTTFGKYLPRELMVTDVDALRGYYQGNDTLYRWEHLRAWLPPVLRWMAFILALLFVMLCLSNLLRKLWVERERLTFPIVILPLQMTDERVPFWRNGLLWAGILLAGGVNVLNGLNYMIPSLPAINVKHQDLLPYITQKPWNAIGWTPYSFYPFVIGLGYLLPLDLVFSCWFFYIFWKAELVVSNAMAWDTIPDFPFIREQAFGGYMAILVFLTWTARGYLKAVWQKAWHGTGELSDREEAMSYRATLIGLAAGVAFLVGFLWYYGMSPVWAVLAVAIYFALTLAVMRMRAELGPPVHDLHFSGPDHVITRAFGTGALDGRSLAVLNFFYWFNRAYRSHPAPVVIESQRIAGSANASQRRMAVALMLAVLVGGLSSFWAFVHLGYQLGTASKFFQGIWFGNEAYNRLATWISTPSKPNPQANWAMAIGFGICSLLMFMRLKLLWFPFHPIGFAISGSWSMNLVWLPLFIAWLVKWLVLHYGSLRTYRRLEPFFLGLMLGEFIVGSIWSLLGMFTDLPTYSFWGA